MAADFYRTDCGDDYPMLPHLIGIIGIVGFIALATIHENIIIEIVGVLSSTLFILLLLGLARIIDYLFKIHEGTKKISSQINQIVDHIDN